MEFINLANTDLSITRVALGTWIFGGRRWGLVNKKDSKLTIKHAFESGINFFDTSDAYGSGYSETLLGEAFHGKRHKVVIASKVGVVWNKDGTVKIDLSAKHINNAIEASLIRLKTDYIDLYQLHEMDPKIGIEEVGEALLKLLESGKVRHIGVSNFDTTSIDRLKMIVPITSIQSEYGLIKREIENDIIPYCQSKGISLLTYSPLYRGILSGKFDKSSTFKEDDNRYYDEEFKGNKFLSNISRINKLVELSNSVEKKPSQVAIRWLLDQQAVASVILGARNKGQLDDNLGAVDWTLSEESHTILSEIFS